MEVETYASQDNYFVKYGRAIKVTSRNNLVVREFSNYLKMPKFLMFDFIKARAMRKFK